MTGVQTCALPISFVEVRQESQKDDKASKLGFLKKINFNVEKSKPVVNINAERDPFSVALERSFGSEKLFDETEPFDEPVLSSYDGPEVQSSFVPEPMPEISIQEATPTPMPKLQMSAKKEIEEPTFEPVDVQNEASVEITHKAEPFFNVKAPENLTDTQRTINELKKEWDDLTTHTEPVVQKEIIAQKIEEKEDELYPFGGWVDEDNYKK